MATVMFELCNFFTVVELEYISYLSYIRCAHM